MSAETHFREHLERQFDYYSKKSIANSAIDKARRCKRDRSTGEPVPSVFEYLLDYAVYDRYELDLYVISTDIIEIQLKDEHLYKALKKLSDREADSLVLSELNGYSNDEIGDILGVKSKSVTKYKKRAKDKIRKEYQRYEGTDL